MTISQLPKFREQFAVVFDDYMDTLGGGERSALAYAKALKDLGFYVEIISTRPIPDQAKVLETFGEEFADLRIRHIKVKNLSHFLSSAELSVFVNHTYMSFLPNPAKVGIYSQMFPNHPICRVTHPKETQALASYQLMLSNSSYTKTYADGYWEYPVDRSYILSPPIGKAFVDSANSMLHQRLNKQKQFIHVGRFNPGNHNKNQLVIMDAFLRASSSHSLLQDWRLVLVGNVNQTPEAFAYYDECKKLVQKSNGRIEILEDLPQTALLEQLKQSFGYVHGTGAFLAPGVEPQRCEHFGLSIIEAMAFGCIPLVYARGGIFDVIEPGINGIPYLTFEGLQSGMLYIAEQWNTSEAENFQKAAVQAAREQGQEQFTSRLAQYISAAMQ